MRGFRHAAAKPEAPSRARRLRQNVLRRDLRVAVKVLHAAIEQRVARHRAADRRFRVLTDSY